MAYRTTQEAIPSLRICLELTLAEPLKRFVALITGKNGDGRKADLVNQVLELMNDDATLKKIWASLDSVQKNAVSETVHSSSPHFDSSRFRAKYGKEPTWGKVDNYKSDPNYLNLLFFSGIMPDDIKKRLKSFVPIPKEADLPSNKDIPATFDLHTRGWDPITKRYETAVEPIDITIVETEICALPDLQTILGLIDAGKISVSDKTWLPTSAGVRSVSALLFCGDFYNESTSENRSQDVGSIKAFAWPMIVQAGGLAELSGKRLQLTKAGQKALTSAPEKTLRSIWNRWLKTRILDEFRRIDIIKGQTGKGQKGFTALSDRRTTINEALTQCPVGEWVEINSLFRYMRATGLDFEVHRSPWYLYITDAHYGGLGDNDWNLFQKRYALCLLFEYAATMGLIDVAYILPHGVSDDFRRNWGTDDLEFLSRYDGLLYIRLNALGSYCVGLTDDFKSSIPENVDTLKVLPNLDLVAMGKKLPPSDVFFLETYAVKVSDAVWRLDQTKFLEVIENGGNLDKFVEWLKARSAKGVPDPVLRFLSDVKERTTALRSLGMAKIIECSDPALATLIANDSKTGKFCSIVGDRNLVVLVEFETQFRSAVRKLGYSLQK